MPAFDPRAAANVIRRMTGWELAKHAGCSSPANRTSAGSLFLENVRDAVLEAWRRHDLAQETCDQIAEDAPDVMSGVMWQEFIDLCAYSAEDEVESGLSGSMEDRARQLLEHIASQLVNALVGRLDAEES